MKIFKGNKDKEKNENNDLKIKDKISLKMRKRNFVNNSFTFFIVIDLIIAFLAINLIKESIDLPEIDVTADKIFTLSDESKDIIRNIDQDVKIYLYGIDEENSVTGLVKQYCETNEKITYEILTKESNLAKIQEFKLENADGYSMVIVESGGGHKVIDTSEFYSYDNSTYKESDLTEQVITNSIVAMVTENKPHIYFTEGHGEYDLNVLGLLSTYLKNEVMEYASVNLMTEGKVPDNCDVLAIMSMTSDLLENEAQYILDYINKGGNIFIAHGILEQGITLPNLQKVLDVYGAIVENGVIVETSATNTVPNYPYVFIPNVSTSHEIMQDINSSKSPIYLAYATRITKASDEVLESLNVTSEDLLTSSENALFVTDFSTSLSDMSSAQTGKFVISSLFTKTINNENISEEIVVDENSTEENQLESKLILIGNGSFIADYVVEELSQSYPISYLGSNKELALNILSYLGNRDSGLSIIKDTGGSSYVYKATTTQNIIVIVIIFAIPILIIFAGIVVWHYRKKRK